MAAQAGAVAVHATLSGTTADTVTFTGSGSTLAVTNRDASVTLYFRADGTAAVSAADDNYVVLPLQTKTLNWNVTSSTSISVVGNGNAYSVEIR